MDLNRHRFIYTADEAQRLPKDQPYIAYVCYYDWTEGTQPSTLMHCHENLAEILLILKGHGRYTVDLRCQEVSAGDVILCNGSALHDEFPQTDQPYQTLCIAIGNLALPDLPPHCLIDSKFNPRFHHPEQFDDLMQLFCQIDRYAAEREAGYQTLCQYLMLASLELVKRMVNSRKDPFVIHEESIFWNIAKYIDQHYAEEITIDQLVRQFYISPYHLSHMFKQKTGYSLKQYILRRRIGEAQMRLIHTQDPIQTISEAVGFEDASYFSRIFSKYIGLTPSEYRKYRTRP